MISAGAGIHGGYQHESGGKGQAARRTGYGDPAVLERLTHDLQGGAVELGQLVQEQNPVMGQADLAGSDVACPAEEADVRDGMVGIPEGTLANDRFAG